MTRERVVERAGPKAVGRAAPRSGERGVVVPLRRPGAGAYDAAFASALRGALARHQVSYDEAETGRSWADAVAAAPAARRRLMVRNRAASWWATLRLADLAEQRVRTAPGDAADLAEVAAEALGRVPAGAVPPVQTADLAGRLWRLRALAWTSRRELGRAREALRQARRRLCRGTGEPLERALLLEARAALLAAEGRESRAVRLLAMAAAVFHQLGECLLERRVRAAMARHPAA